MRVDDNWASVFSAPEARPAFGPNAWPRESMQGLACLSNMRVDIRWKGQPKSQSLADHVQNRLRFALHGFREKVRTFTVRFEDINGPRGGIDKRCSVELTGAFGILVVEASDSNFYTAADLALSRAERAVAKALKRDRHSRERLVEHIPIARS